MTEQTPSPISLRSVVLDCPDPPSLALFYGELLGGRVVSNPDWSEVHIEHVPLKLALQRVDGYAPPEWPDGRPQQLHLDFTVLDLRVASDRAVGLGARILGDPVDEEGSTFQVHADPSGHPFCLVVERPRS
jgi:predicted enzyme related to lactoylglutathione lyase